MYIVAIAWLYVTLLMAFTEDHLVAGAMSFIFYGLLPTALLWWLTSRRHRRSVPPARAKKSDSPPN
ncbi:MAG TPA: hypothetical protein PKY22_13385 [Accumulibacter sp.]|nr:hypothetical protein [Accumulibacter sp.]